MEGTRTAYATKSDFSRVLTAEMDRLYLLAFLLTADHALAEQSFTTVAENAFSAKPVFKGWVHSWLRREVAKTALELLANKSAEKTADHWFGNDKKDFAIRMVTQLDPPLRSVFVLSVLEGYSIKECALLLDASTSSVLEVKNRALAAIPAEMKSYITEKQPSLQASA